jgi:hypothetical protein
MGLFCKENWRKEVQKMEKSKMKSFREESVIQKQIEDLLEIFKRTYIPKEYESDFAVNIKFISDMNYFACLNQELERARLWKEKQKENSLTEKAQNNPNYQVSDLGMEPK